MVPRSFGMLVSLLAALAPAALAVAAEDPFPPRVQTYKRLGDVSLDVHLTFPSDGTPARPRPVAVLFYGGGWGVNAVESGVPLAHYLADRGFAVVQPDLREPGTSAGPIQVGQAEDGRSAVRWVRAHAPELGVDPERLVVFGASSGGHVAASTMMARAADAETADLGVSTVPQAMVLFNPILDLESEHFVTDLGLGSETAARLSPLRHLGAESPPSLVLFGSEDPILSHGQAWWQKAGRVGARAERYLAEGEGHGFHATSPQRERALLAVDGFLASLGFVEPPPPFRVTGDTAIVRDAARAWPSLDLWVAALGGEAFLLDGEGAVLHAWSDPEREAGGGRAPEAWGRAHLFENGDLLVARRASLVKLDRDSKLLWRLEAAVHDELVVRADGSVWVLARVEKPNAWFDERHAVELDEVVEVGADGVERRRVPLLQALIDGSRLATIHALKARYRARRPSREAVAGSSLLALPKGTPLSQKGADLLVALPTIDSLVALQLRSGSAVVAFTSPHLVHPSGLAAAPDGRLLVFSNARGDHPPRALELDPATGAVPWQYTGSDTHALFALGCCGALQSLPNGNVLIVERDLGRVLELARDGAVLREFYPPAGRRLGDFRKLPVAAAGFLAP